MLSGQKVCFVSFGHRLGSLVSETQGGQLIICTRQLSRCFAGSRVCRKPLRGRGWLLVLCEVGGRGLSEAAFTVLTD
jgi:hypothetical protein